MDNIEKWNGILMDYFKNVTADQLVKDAAEAGISLIKMKRLKVKKRKKKTPNRIHKMGLRCGEIR